MASSTIKEHHRIVKIGIPVLDERIKGLPTNSVILITGDPGSGFITFLHQILYYRQKNGAEVLYIALDKPKEEVKWECETYKWNIDNWQFIDLSPGAKQDETTALTWSSSAINMLSHDLIRKINERKIKTDDLGKKITLDTTINSLTSMLLNSDLSTVLGFLNEYSMAIKNTQGLHFLTLVKGVHGHDVEQILAHFADVVLEFSAEKRGKEYQFTMGIRKMRGTSTPPHTLFPLEFTKKGILPTTTETVR